MAKIDKKISNTRLLRLLADNLPDMLWAKDLKGRYLFANRAICENLLMAKDTEEPIGKTDVFFAERERAKHPERQDWHTFGELCFNSDVVTLEHMKPMRFEEYGHVRGKMLYLEVHKAPFFDDEGNLIGTVGSGRDITRQKELEAELNRQHEEMKLLIESTIEALFILNDQGRCIYANKVACDLTGYEQQALENMPIHHLIGQEVEGLLKQHQYDSAFELNIQHKQGKIIPVLAQQKRMKLFSQPVTVLALLNLSDIKAAQQRIEHLAFYDSLTNLPNRSLLQERYHQFSQLFAHSRAYSALMFIDIDDFKNINDLYGHEVGDELLRQLARRLKKIVRQSDILIRFGGDEFVLILPELDNDELQCGQKAEQFAQRLQAVFSQPIALAQDTVSVQCSIGIVLFNNKHVPLSLYLRQADIAMFEAKKQGKDRICFFNTEMQKQIHHQIELEKDIQIALMEQQFELYYQPQVDRQGRIYGAEALCRWQHPKKGLIPPLEFIPFAEQSGQIITLGQWVLEQACQQLAAWQQKGAPFDQLTLNINVSARQFYESGFISSIQGLLNRYQIKPQYLVLELTESILLENSAAVMERLQKLRSLGIYLSLDDFGTHFSALSYLKKLPLTQLKIDKSFVNDILDDENDRAIVAAIIAIAQTLHLDVIAEGIENSDQYQKLIDMGCQQFQGYFFGRPVHIDRFEQIVLDSV